MRPFLWEERGAGRIVVGYLPDVPNFSWFEYRLRVGFWRILDATRSHRVPMTMALNGSVCDAYPQVARAALDAGWDVVGHGYHQRALPAEAAAVRRALGAIEAFSGTRPLGWLGPGLGETDSTPELLVSEGVEFVLDWVNDDQPYELKVANGRLFSVPYSKELNDIGVYVRLGHPGPSLLERVHDHLTTLLNDEPETTRVMSIGLHPFIVGQPAPLPLLREDTGTHHEHPRRDTHDGHRDLPLVPRTDGVRLSVVPAQAGTSQPFPPAIPAKAGIQGAAQYCLPMLATGPSGVTYRSSDG